MSANDIANRLRPQTIDLSGLPIGHLEFLGHRLAEWQRGVNWWIGDLARAAKERYPETWHQAFPEWISPGLVNRCLAVAEAYPREADRNPLATWSQHMQVASKPDRLALVAAMVDAGQTTDESRAAAKDERTGSRWLLAVDVNYYLHRFWHSGAGVEAASGVAKWIERTVERLREKGLTDCVCCFDAPNNHRKKLTEGWDAKYKDRPPKDAELSQQLQLVRQLLDGFACVSVETMEADDLMASYAKQFDGRITLLSQDKDLRQCLSDHCNMLLDVTWTEDETSGEMLPEYKWLSAKQHTELTGITPAEWPDYQCLMGDNCDGIKGAVGIGEKGAADLIKLFGNAVAAIVASKEFDQRIKPRQREALVEFEGKLEVTRKLVTLRTDLEVPRNTRLT